MSELRDGTQVIDPRLDRLASFDERSRNFPVTAVISAQTPVTKTWTIPSGEPVLDQGNEGACVGFGVTNELRFNPVPVPDLTAAFARQAIYWGAQRIDEWPGGAYPGARPFYEGTSVLAGIKTAAKLGYYSAYHWAFGEDQLALAVSYVGPCVIGIPWYSGMFQPNAQGYLTISGSVQGGHCVLVYGINVRSSYYTIYNSWGAGWGNKGTAKIRRRDLARLLSEDGDACVITSRTRPNA